MAKQLLEFFQSKTHWHTKEIIDTVKKAYNVIIKHPIAYKVKRWARRMLYGSMKEQYSKVGSYLVALEKCDPVSQFVLETIQGNPLVFRRLFLYFKGLRQGWLLGCRKFQRIDACFLKTLCDQLISVLGRDINDQMFPLACVVTELEQ